MLLRCLTGVRPTRAVLTFFVSVYFSVVACSQEAERPLRWWKGNLHTHSLWSDGDDFPEMIAAWYAERDYNFLALSDHNVLSRGQRWMPLEKIVARSDEGILPRYQAKFGKAWVETRGEPGQTDYEVRLKPLDEFRCLVEQAGKFLMIEAEEVSDKAQGKPVHMNVSNLSQVIEPAGGATVQEVMQNNLRLMLEHEKASGRQVLPHLNHPNFGYAVVAADIAKTIEERFFEVYNGHPGVNQLGDKDHQSVESMWDVVNAMRIAWLDSPPIMGIATDDSHEYHGKPGSRPGRGWVMVRARYLTPEHLILAMKAGDFYASSGVELEDMQFDAKNRKLSLKIAAASSATYETKFIVISKSPSTTTDSAAGTNDKKTRESEAGQPPLPTAKVAMMVTGLTPEYTMKEDDLYVRALVTSSLPHVDPSLEDQKQQAWTQPVGYRQP